MNFKRKLIAIIVCLFVLVSATACGECEHDWGKLKIVTKATCTEVGVKERKCELCGETETITIPLESHKWKLATCTAPKTCKVCALTVGEPNEHLFVKETKKPSTLKREATVENPIAEYYKSCSCGKISQTETFEVKTMVGKNILIFGDSYSSYAGTIPDGYRVYYSGTNILNSPDQMWWSLLVQERGGIVVRNDSSSGSTINTGGYHSFIGRLNKLYSDGFFEENQIDYVFVLGGTNDNGGHVLGEEMYSGWTDNDLSKVLPAICYFFTRIREILPDAEIYGITNLRMQQGLIDAIYNATEHVGGNYVGIKVELESGHPTALGMQQIKDEILKVFDK